MHWCRMMCHDVREYYLKTQLLRYVRTLWDSEYQRRMGMSPQDVKRG